MICCQSVRGAKAPEAKNCFGKGLCGWCACFLPLWLMSTRVNSRKGFTGRRWGPGLKNNHQWHEVSFTSLQMGRQIIGNAVAYQQCPASLQAVHSLSCPVCQLIFVFLTTLHSGRGWTVFNLVCLVALRYCYLTVWEKIMKVRLYFSCSPSKEISIFPYGTVFYTARWLIVLQAAPPLNWLIVIFRALRKKTQQTEFLL